MKTDIFEDMKERVGCENISDLPYRKRMVWEIIKQHSPLDYPKEQLEKFSHYVFGVDYAVIMGIHAPEARLAPHKDARPRE